MLIIYEVLVLNWFPKNRIRCAQQKKLKSMKLKREFTQEMRTKGIQVNFMFQSVLKPEQFQLYKFRFNTNYFRDNYCVSKTFLRRNIFS